MGPETKAIPKSIINALPARLGGQWAEMRTVYISAGCNHVLGQSGNKLFIENSKEACLANVTSFSRLVSHLCLREARPSFPLLPIRLVFPVSNVQAFLVLWFLIFSTFAPCFLDLVIFLATSVPAGRICFLDFENLSSGRR